MAEIRVAEVLSCEISFAEVGSTEVGSTEVGSTEVGFAEVGFAEDCFAEVLVAEVLVCEISCAELGSAELGSAEVGSAEVGFAEVGFAEVGKAEVRTYRWISSFPVVPRSYSLLKHMKMLIVRHTIASSWYLIDIIIAVDAYLSKYFLSLFSLCCATDSFTVELSHFLWRYICKRANWSAMVWIRLSLMCATRIAKVNPSRKILMRSGCKSWTLCRVKRGVLKRLSQRIGPFKVCCSSWNRMEQANIDGGCSPRGCSTLRSHVGRSTISF